MRCQISTIAPDAATPTGKKSHSVLDRSQLPAPDAFYRQNLEQYRQYGSKARATCPFHTSSNRHSTSLSIDLDRGLFHCFRCGAGGDIVKFLMLRDNCDFITAAKTLGVLRPLSRVEAQVYWHDRDAKQARQQRKDDEFYEWLELLLKEMEIYESVRDWAFRHHHDELYDLAEQLIVAVGADFVLLKADAL
jgi:hypothetical protein